MSGNPLCEPNFLGPTVGMSRQTTCNLPRSHRRATDCGLIGRAPGAVGPPHQRRGGEDERSVVSAAGD
jgi:hypothetical protein